VDVADFEDFVECNIIGEPCRNLTGRINLDIGWPKAPPCGRNQCWVGCITSTHSRPRSRDRVFAHHRGQQIQVDFFALRRRGKRISAFVNS